MTTNAQYTLGCSRTIRKLARDLKRSFLRPFVCSRSNLSAEKALRTGSLTTQATYVCIENVIIVLLLVLILIRHEVYTPGSFLTSSYMFSL